MKQTYYVRCVLTYIAVFSTFASAMPSVDPTGSNDNDTNDPESNGVSPEDSGASTSAGVTTPDGVPIFSALEPNDLLISYTLLSTTAADAASEDDRSSGSGTAAAGREVIARLPLFNYGEEYLDKPAFMGTHTPEGAPVDIANVRILYGRSDMVCLFEYQGDRPAPLNRPNIYENIRVEAQAGSLVEGPLASVTKIACV